MMKTKLKTKPRMKPNQVTVATNRRDGTLSAAGSRKPQPVASPFQRKKFLVPVDFSDCSRQALDYALPFAWHFRAGLTLLHVVHVNYYATGGDFATYDYPDLVEETHRAGEKQLGDLARSIRKKYPVNTMLQSGHPGNLIVDTARKLGVGLIITSTHGRTGFKRAFLGSTAEHVVRYAPCPVLTVPGRSRPARRGKTSPFQLKKILVPVDFSKVSKAALAYAAFLAGQFGTEFILLHVTEKSPIDYLLGPGLMNHLVVPMMKQAEADLARLAGSLSKAHGAHLTAIVRTGKPFEEICRAARTLGADLIVLTTHGHTGLKHVMLGSTAERVVRHADCPVLVVRDRLRVGGGKRSARRQIRS